MNKIAIAAAFLVLAACSKQEPAPAPEVTASATTAAQTLAADGKPSTGTFTVTGPDGKVTTEEVKADGTYVDTQDGKVTETGRWEQKSPETYCFTKDEAGAKQHCGTEKVDDKGVWTSVSEDGKTYKVVRTAG